jgi:hypothetical protein
MFISGISIHTFKRSFARCKLSKGQAASLGHIGYSQKFNLIYFHLNKQMVDLTGALSIVSSFMCLVVGWTNMGVGASKVVVICSLI